MRLRRQHRPLLVALALGVAAQVLFSVRLTQPGVLDFDEAYYVPAARALLALSGPTNIEHPLFGKTLIAIGIALFGDNPIGWRAMSTVAGTATIVGGYALLLLLLRNLRFAAFGAILLMLGQLVFVQARIATLDVFLGALLIWGLVLLIVATRSPRALAWWIAGSTLLGLAAAVKWAAVPYIVLADLLGTLHFARDKASSRAWVVPGLTLGIALFAYLLTFLPAFFYRHDPLTLARLIPLHREMVEIQRNVQGTHPYQSHWWSWPLMLRPIWYFYQGDLGAVRRGVLLIGNPVILWGGLIALIGCCVAWLRERATVPGALASLWAASLGFWAITPKPIAYFYYYYLPSIFLCLATAAAFHHYDRGKAKRRELWFAGAAALMFAYFYPVLSAAPLASEGAFANWTWFTSWR